MERTTQWIRDRVSWETAFLLDLFINGLVAGAGFAIPLMVVLWLAR